MNFRSKIYLFFFYIIILFFLSGPQQFVHIQPKAFKVNFKIVSFCVLQLSHDLTRLKEHYEKKMKDLMTNTVGGVEIQQLKQKHELKVTSLIF